MAEDFQQAILRSIRAACGTTYEEMAAEYDRVWEADRPRREAEWRQMMLDAWRKLMGRTE